MSGSRPIVVSALVRDSARILLVEERGPGDPAATWMLPGGKVERGETLTNALSRELREETGLEVVGDPSIAFTVEIVADDESYTAITFDCATGGEVRPADPDGLVLAAAWLPIDDALGRLAAVAWHDCVPLQRFLSGAAGPGATYVVDRR